MENKNWAEEILSKYSLEDKLLAAGIISFDYDLFNVKVSDALPGVAAIEHTKPIDIAYIDNIVRRHIYSNGAQGVDMAVRVGRAMKASIQNPLKPSFSLGSYFKEKIKAALS